VVPSLQTRRSVAVGIEVDPSFLPTEAARVARIPPRLIDMNA
jgi:hypothetical protein